MSSLYGLLEVAPTSKNIFFQVGLIPNNAYAGVMRKNQLVDIVRATCESMPIPDSPSDTGVPIMFGKVGFVMQTNEGSMVLSSFSVDSLDEILSDPFIPLSADLFGYLMFVTYGAVAQIDPRTGDVEDDTDVIATRIIVGVSREGAVVSALRRLDNNEALLDENGDTVQGELRDLLLEIAQG